MSTIQVQITEQVSPKNVATVDNPTLRLEGNVYNKQQTEQKINDKTTVNLQGSLSISDPAPNIKGFWFLTQVGTYSNLGGLVAISGKLNIASYNGTTWTLIKVDFPIDTAKIPTWQAQSYTIGSQVIYNGEVFEATSATTNSDTPKVSSKWSRVIGGLDEDALYNIIFPDDHITNETFKGFDYLTILGSGTYNANASVLFAPDFPVKTSDSHIDKIYVNTYDGATKIKVYSLNGDNSSPEDTGYTLDAAGKEFTTLSNGTKLYTFDVDYNLPAGKKLGFHLLSGAIYYNFAPGNYYNTYVTYTPGIFTLENLGVSFGYNLATPGQKYKSWAEGLSTDPTFIESVKEISGTAAVKEKLDNTIYRDSLASEANWSATGWTYSSQGKFTSNNTGSNNNLRLNKTYNLNKRSSKFRIKPSSNCDFRIYNRKDATIGGTVWQALGGTMFGINFSTNKISIYKSYIQFGEIESITDTVHAQTDLEIPYVTDHEYVIETKYYETTHFISITDATTGNTQSWEVENASIMDVGRQQGNYTFYCMSGSAEFFEIEVKTISDVDILFVGDSITEAVGVPLSARWWKKMELNGYIGKYLVTARGGQTIQDIIDKFNDDISTVKPKKIIYLLGANGGGTVSQYTQLKTLADNAGIQCLFSLQPTRQDGAHTTWNDNLINAVTRDRIAFKFNNATSVNNDGTTYNSACFIDGIHPNETGSTKMALRGKLDLF